MIPVFLTIEGLYSYQKKQVVDFARLTEAGLFGIFGTVGSGKSSILEAISYVLYDRIERLSKADKRSYNMMNLRSDRMYIEFDFYNSDNKLYRVTKEVKRNSKRFDDVKTPVMVFYEKVDQVWMALEHTDAEKIIGLTYENFKRTIIIPQGQFKEFLELGAKDRTQMMMEIFDLHRFDLQDTTSSIMSKNRTDKDQLLGKLSAFEEVSESVLITLKEQLSLSENELKQHIELHQKINTEYQQFLQSLNEWEILQVNTALFNQLKVQKPAMDAKKERIDTFENAYNTFYHLFKNEAELTIYCTKKRDEKEKLQRDLNQIIQKLEASNESLNTLQKPYDQLENDKIKVANLEVIIEINKLNEERERLLARLKKGREVISEEEAKKKAVEDMVSSTQDSLHDLKSQKIDTALLLSVDKWYNDRKNLVDRKADITKALTDIEKKIADNLESLHRQNMAPETFITDYNKQIESIEQQKNYLQSMLMHLQAELKLSEYAEALEDGKPCPLCGSIHHPNIREEKEVALEVEDINLKLSNLNADTKLLTQQKNIFDDSIKNNQLWITQRDEMSEHMNSVQQQEKYLQDSFVWQEFESDNPDKFNLLKNQSVALENEVKGKEEKLALYRKQVEIHQENIFKYQEGLKAFDTSAIQHEASIQEKKSQLKSVQYEDYAQNDYHEIQALCTQLIEHIKQVETNYKRLEKEIIELSNQKASAQTAFSGMKQQLDEWEDKLEAVQQEIKSKLAPTTYASIDSVKNILAQPINVNEERKRIEDFVIEYKTTEAKIKESEFKLQGIQIDSRLKEEKELAYKASETRLSESTAKVAQQKVEVERLTKRMNEKNELQIKLDVLLQREENLKTIFNLMKGSGFVQYISTIYLRQLCDHANVRFHRMTRNQLSLQLNENNDFEVIDYLNEGRSRSVKTLSGGQSFQVSLSLALALAESVQRHSKSNQNFFFIDEGFGTQDIESVNIVFDTLNRLHKENRIVGIISHVEELKDRIPIALQVNRDEEHGSIITIEK